MARVVQPQHFCDLESLCYELQGIEAWEFNEEGEAIAQTYICGYIPAGTVLGCPRMQKLAMEVKDGN